MSSKPKCGSFYETASLAKGCRDTFEKPCVGCRFNEEAKLKRESGRFVENSHDGKNENIKETLSEIETQSVFKIVNRALKNIDLESLGITALQMEYVKAGVRILAKAIDIELRKTDE